MNAGQKSDYHALLKEAYLEIRRLRAGTRREEIAVIGMGCRFPGGCDSPEKLSRLLMAGHDATSAVPAERGDWSKDLADVPLIAGFADGVEQFDPLFFGISPREAEAMDPQQRILLMSAWEALERAGMRREDLRESPTGVFVGIYNSDYAWSRVRDIASMDAYAAGGMEHAFAPNRLSYFLDLKGPSIALNTACSSSLTALHYACNSLRNEECDMALAAGVNLILSPLSMLVASRLLALAPDGKCKSFDARADGIVRGEGCGVVVLKRLKDALRDGDPIDAVIAGTAVNEDGRTNVLTAPNGLAQEAVMREALRRAEVSPEEVAFVETHGTGTPLGDPIEFSALRAVYGKGDWTCALGAIKSNLGHLEAAAGMAGLFKTIQVLKNGEIPPNLHLEHINPEIDTRDTRLVFPREPLPWPEHAPRMAGVSAFGAGGVNAHAIVKGPPPIEEMKNESPAALLGPLPISALNTLSLRSLAAAYRTFLQDGGSVENLRHTASVGRDHYSHRLAITAENKPALIELLEKFEKGEPDPCLVSKVLETVERPRTAFVFSGQATEFAGMAAGLLQSPTSFRETFERCDELIRSIAGWSPLREIRNLERTEIPTRIAQPLLCALQISLLEHLRAMGFAPDAVIGHSLGELAAARAAGILSDDDTLRLALRRGELMEHESAQGSMAAFEVSEAQAREMLRDFAGRLVVAAVNSPGDVVISGDSRAMEELRERNPETFRRLVNTSYAFHSPGMAGAATAFQSIQAPAFNPPTLPFYSSVTGARESEFGLGRLAGGIRNTVRFADGIAAMVRDGLRVFVEIGPRPALGAYIKETSSVALSVLPSLRKSISDDEALRLLCANLYALGVDPQWNALQAPRSRRISIPTYAWNFSVFPLPVSSAIISKNDTNTAAAKTEVVQQQLPVEPVSPLDRVRSFLGEILHLPAEQVDIHAHMHLQGVGSLAAAELRNRLRAELGVNVPATRILGGMSPRELAEITASRDEQTETSPEEPVTLMETTPASPLERVLVRLFAETSGTADYPRTLDFKDDETTLVALRERLRLNLPFAPSMEQLRAARNPAALTRVLYAMSAERSTGSSFVTKPIANPQAQLLLFCFPHGGGNADFYRGWKLDERVELISLQPPGQGERFMEEPITDMNAYLDLVTREFSPLLTKPWATFGHSMGTLIAYEFARRVRRAGGIAPRHMIVSAGPAPVFIEETIGDLSERAVRETIRKGIPEAVMNDRELRDLFVPALLADISKLGNYVFQAGAPLDCDITVLAGENDELVQSEHSRAWRDFTRGNFDFRILPGGHHYAYTHRDRLLAEINSLLAEIIR